MSPVAPLLGLRALGLKVPPVSRLMTVAMASTSQLCRAAMSHRARRKATLLREIPGTARIEGTDSSPPPVAGPSRHELAKPVAPAQPRGRAQLVAGPDFPPPVL